MSTLELTLYMPLLFVLCFLTIQFSLIYLGTQVASSAAREGARIARSGGGTEASLAEARASASDYANRIGNGLIENVTVEVQPIAGQRVRAVVTGDAVQILPIVPMPQVRMVSEGPVETFRPDGP